jgi:hypothetical protein
MRPLDLTDREVRFAPEPVGHRIVPPGSAYDQATIARVDREADVANTERSDDRASEAPHQVRTRNNLIEAQRMRPKSNESTGKSTKLTDILPLITIWS